MKEVLYIEIPTPAIAQVNDWLRQEFDPGVGEKISTINGIRLKFSETTSPEPSVPEISERDTGLCNELSTFTWSVQRTTYLKVFRWANQPLSQNQQSQEKQFLQQLNAQVRDRFPNNYPEPPVVDLSNQSVFEVLADHYPLTVRYFQKMPNGEYDLTRVYWWEQRWREGVRNPQQPNQVVFKGDEDEGQNRGQGSGVRGQESELIQNSKFKIQNSSTDSSLTPHLSSPNIIPHPPIRPYLHRRRTGRNPCGGDGSFGLQGAAAGAVAVWQNESGVEYFSQ